VQERRRRCAVCVAAAADHHVRLIAEQRLQQSFRLFGGICVIAVDQNEVVRFDPLATALQHFALPLALLREHRGAGTLRISLVRSVLLLSMT
jgi:hypothetical protein